MPVLTDKSIPDGPYRLSVDEYLELPDDGKRYQILDGVLDVTPAPSPRHQRVSRRLLWHLMAELERKGKGEVFNAPIDVVLDRHSVVQPDLVFLRAEHAHEVGERGIEGAPDLVVEILSPSTRRTDVLTKSALYARFGIAEYWIVDPDIDKVEVYVLRDGRYVLTSSVSAPEALTSESYPGLAIPLDEVFA